MVLHENRIILTCALIDVLLVSIAWASSKAQVAPGHQPSHSLGTLDCSLPVENAANRRTLRVSTCKRLCAALVCLNKAAAGRGERCAGPLATWR